MELALQSVTSVPARSLEIDHRVGFVKPGYDADLVVWDSHPLSVGATALQVYIDGVATLDPKKVADSLSGVKTASEELKIPVMRKTQSADIKETLCKYIEKDGAKFTVTGITTSHMEESLETMTTSSSRIMVVNNGKIICFDSQENCASTAADSMVINLNDGHVLPGLTAVSVSLGLTEIAADSSTGDGKISSSASIDLDNVVYAKYGVHLEGRGFSRARLGGVTKVVTAPISQGFVGGVSVGIKTSDKKSILDGGIFQDDIALHFKIGQRSKGKLSKVVNETTADML